MTVIGFSRETYIEHMISGRKTTTIRANWARWVRECEARHDLHVYYGSRFKPPRHFVGKCQLLSVMVKRGSQFTEEDAHADGFDTLEELYEALEDASGFVRAKVIEAKWAILEMGEWLDGPYPVASSTS